MSGRPCGPRLAVTWSKDRSRCSKSEPAFVVELSNGTFSLQEGPVTGLLEVAGHAQDQPERVVVETATDIRVAALGQGLVLVPGAAVLELRGGHVEEALPHALGHLVHASQQVLAGVAEPDAAADAALEVARAARQVARDHALVLVPDVHHPVELLVARGNGEPPQEVVPAGAQDAKLSVDLRVGVEPRRNGVRALPVERPGAAHFSPPGFSM